jgi:hypothetical protein
MTNAQQTEKRNAVAALIATYANGMSKASARRFANNAYFRKITDPIELQRLADYERGIGRHGKS